MLTSLQWILIVLGIINTILPFLCPLTGPAESEEAKGAAILDEPRLSREDAPKAAHELQDNLARMFSASRQTLVVGLGEGASLRLANPYQLSHNSASRSGANGHTSSGVP
jgi:hypothetical protein